MDNNFNQQQMPQTQASGQPVYQQQMPQTQAPGQQAYQQQMPQTQMPQQPVYQQAPKKPSNTNTKELLALILSSVGAIMSVIGSIFTCSCSASKTWDASDVLSFGMSALGGDVHSTSAVMIVALIGGLVSAVGVVFGILAIKDKNATVKAGKMAYIAMAIGAFGFMYGVLPVLTICGYNCSLNSNMEDMISNSLGDMSSFF